MPVMCAPLIFPALDATVAATMADQKNGEAPAGALAAQIRAKSKSAQKFVQSYMDKRGQATFVCFFDKTFWDWTNDCPGSEQPRRKAHLSS